MTEQQAQEEAWAKRVESLGSETVEHVEEGVRDIERELLAEVRSLHVHLNLLHRHHEELHAKVDALQRHQNRVVYRHQWLSHLMHDLAYEPRLQYRIHITATVFWIGNLVAVLVAQWLFPDQWAGVAVLYVAVVSLYANGSTDYSGASAALAAMGSRPLPEVPMMERDRLAEAEFSSHPPNDQAS